MADADSPCAPLVPCENLSGAVLVRRTVYGPSLIDDPRPLAFGELALSGGAIRPYIDLIYETRWIPKGLCRGPVSSVMSLAPTESITAGVRTAHRESFTQTMTDAAESSSVYTHTRHQLSESTHQSDRKSTRLNSSHRCISYAVFCLKKKKQQNKDEVIDL